ncbi:MAG TPA: ATPase domain-containing protein [Archangium sp.]|uniref:RAD55 family ATPase n=1 Tax=Archangium sp. TaxID=1872627 RepID=UPI002E308733|nr:ATPase domain-containing protein [Archangium sp.]HEX5754224.1 ATPase domain-containing protein [Archangium sp.]
MERITTGIGGLDIILGGGLPLNSLNVIAGTPGTGKTILAQQFIFANARLDAPALYLTTLSEPVTKVLRYLQQFSFFDEDKLLGDRPSIFYRDIAEVIRAKGLLTLPDTIMALMNEHRPSYLVIDSFKALRELESTGPDIRRVMFDIAGNLAARACTTLLVGEYRDEEVEQLAEFAIADGILQLVTRAYGTREERYLRVRKLRGSSYRAGEHAFRITERGLVPFPRLVTPERPIGYCASPEHVSTGVAGLDRMFDGGLRRGSSTLVVGAAGSGKTLLGMHFLFAGAAAGEHGLLVSFQENPTLLRHLISGFGWNVEELGERGHLTSLYVSPVEMNIDDIVQQMTAVLDSRPIRRVVIDSMGDLEAASSDPQRFRGYIYSLMQLFAVRGVTAYATYEALVDPDFASFTRMGASYISDNVVALRYCVDGDVHPGGRISRVLAVVKCRGSAHDDHLRQMTIGRHGVEVAGAPPGAGG